MWFQLWLTQLKKGVLHWTKIKRFFLRLLCKTQSAISPLWRHFRWKSHRGSCCFFQAAAPSSPSVHPTRVRTEGPAGWAGKLSSVTAPLGTEGRTAAVVRGLSFVYIDPVVLLVSQHLMVKNEKWEMIGTDVSSCPFSAWRSQMTLNVAGLWLVAAITQMAH